LAFSSGFDFAGVDLGFSSGLDLDLDLSSGFPFESLGFFLPEVLDGFSSFFVVFPDLSFS
jgi:hypothetical protein